MVIEHFKFTSSFQTHFDYMDLSKMVWYGDGADDIIAYIKDMRHLKRCLNTDQLHITQLALTHANFTLEPRLIHMIRTFESHRPKQGVVNSEYTFESLMSKLEEHANHELMKKNLRARENTMNQKFEKHRKKLLKQQGGGGGWGANHGTYLLRCQGLRAMAERTKEAGAKLVAAVVAAAVAKVAGQRAAKADPRARKAVVPEAEKEKALCNFPRQPTRKSMRR